jgi:hypothetical protein
MAPMIYQVLIIVFALRTLDMGTLITKPICRNLLSFQWPPAFAAPAMFQFSIENDTIVVGNDTGQSPAPRYDGC